MLKQINEVLTPVEINTLISHYVFGAEKTEECDRLSEKYSRELTYEMRKHSHSATARNRTLTGSEVEHEVWRCFVRSMIDVDRTTSYISNITGKPLEFINSFV